MDCSWAEFTLQNLNVLFVKKNEQQGDSMIWNITEQQGYFRLCEQKKAAEEESTGTRSRELE